MTRTQLHRFQTMLEAAAAELSCALENSLDRLVISQSGDPMEQVRNQTDREVDSQNIALLTDKLRCLHDALRAIHEGTFGRCAICGAEIPLKRLEAMPWTSCCVACQETAESRRGEAGESVAAGGGGGGGG